MGYIYNLSPINGRPGLVVTWRSCHKGFESKAVVVIINVGFKLYFLVSIIIFNISQKRYTIFKKFLYFMFNSVSFHSTIVRFLFPISFSF